MLKRAHDARGMLLERCEGSIRGKRRQESQCRGRVELSSPPCPSPHRNGRDKRGLLKEFRLKNDPTRQADFAHDETDVCVNRVKNGACIVRVAIDVDGKRTMKYTCIEPATSIPARPLNAEASGAQPRRPPVEALSSRGLDEAVFGQKCGIDCSKDSCRTDGDGPAAEPDRVPFGRRHRRLSFVEFAAERFSRDPLANLSYSRMRDA